MEKIYIKSAICTQPNNDFNSLVMLKKIAETEKAIQFAARIQYQGKSPKTVRTEWFPKSQLTITEEYIELPEWLAREKLSSWAATFMNSLRTKNGAEVEVLGQTMKMKTVVINGIKTMVLVKPEDFEK